MGRLPQCRRRGARGASGIEYFIVVVLIGIVGVAGWKLIGQEYRCKVLSATSLFALNGEKGGADNCEDTGGGAQASNSPSPGGGSNTVGPTPGVTCVGTSCTAGDGNCFVAGTMVVTEDGPRPIESIVAGTQVLSRDAEGDAVDWKPVVRTFVHQTDRLVELTVGDPGSPEIIDVTPTHRVYTKGRGWVEVAELVPGSDVLVDSRGGDVIVRALASIAADTTVYNFQVADFHTYYVGQYSFWAHNACAFHPYDPNPNCLYCGLRPYEGIPSGGNRNPPLGVPNPYFPPPTNDSAFIHGHGALPTMGSAPHLMPTFEVPPNTRLHFPTPVGALLPQGTSYSIQMGHGDLPTLPGGGGPSYGPGQRAPNPIVSPLRSGDITPYDGFAPVIQTNRPVPLSSLVQPGTDNYGFACMGPSCRRPDDLANIYGEPRLPKAAVPPPPPTRRRSTLPPRPRPGSPSNGLPKPAPSYSKRPPKPKSNYNWRWNTSLHAWIRTDRYGYTVEAGDSDYY